jgi:hypothetical protein
MNFAINRNIFIYLQNILISNYSYLKFILKKSNNLATRFIHFFTSFIELFGTL